MKTLSIIFLVGVFGFLLLIFGQIVIKILPIVINLDSKSVKPPEEVST